ncbi:curlin [Shewanella sp. NIFS-20-20]|uniref:curlin n=1 Tax=Shewanella sp. NIFS-20-20 TaxID=2853806 RepID=UPI0035280684
MPHVKYGIVMVLLLLAAKANAEPSAQLMEQAGISLTLQAVLENSGRDNAIRLIQSGELNQATMVQLGVSNESDILQSGNNNQANSTQVGSGNLIKISQRGDDNLANISQIGQNNLVQLNQSNGTSFAIQQIGDGAAISITQYK